MINSVTKNYFNGEFVSYNVVFTNGITSSVPLAEDNTDFQEVQQWIADGNTVIDNGA